MAIPFGHAKYKATSFTAVKDQDLQKLVKLGRTPPVVFLGACMFKNMTDTGRWKDPRPWPSEAMLTRRRLVAINLAREAGGQAPLVRISNVLNAGCWDDSIENMLYRLVGPPRLEGDTEAHGVFLGLKEGLREGLLQRSGHVRLWVVDPGSNTFDEEEGLTQESIDALRELLLTIFSMSSPTTLVLLSGFHYRPDTARDIIDKANEKLRGLTLVVAKDIEALKDKGVLRVIQRTNMENRRQGKKPQAAVNSAAQPEQEVRHDSGVSGPVSANGYIEAMETDASDFFNSLAARGREAAELAELGKSIDRFDFAINGAPTEPKPRIDFLPVPDSLDPERHYNDEHFNLTLEGYQVWMEVLFPKVRDMLDRSESLSHVARSAGNEYEAREPEFTPIRRLGNFHKVPIRRKRGWEHKGTNWLIVNSGTLRKLEDQLRKEGKLVEEAGEQGQSVGAGPSRRAAIVDELAKAAALVDEDSSDPESETTKYEYVIEGFFYTGPAQEDAESSNAVPVAPPAAAANTEQPATSGEPPGENPEPFTAALSLRQRFRAKMTAVLRRFGRRRDEAPRFSLASTPTEHID